MGLIINVRIGRILLIEVTTFPIEANDQTAERISDLWIALVGVTRFVIKITAITACFLMFDYDF